MSESEFYHVSAVVSLNGATRIWQIDCVQNREAQKSFVTSGIAEFLRVLSLPKISEGTIDGYNGP